MIKFAKKHFIDESNIWIDSYNYHPYTSYCSSEHMVKVLGWKKCKEIVQENIKKGYSSKMNIYYNDFQYDFFTCDLQHLLSYYYNDIPHFYTKS